VAEMNERRMEERSRKNMGGKIEKEKEKTKERK